MCFFLFKNESMHIVKGIRGEKTKSVEAWLCNDVSSINA